MKLEPIDVDCPECGCHASAGVECRDLRSGQYVARATPHRPRVRAANDATPTPNRPTATPVENRPDWTLDPDAVEERRQSITMDE